MLAKCTEQIIVSAFGNVPGCKRTAAVVNKQIHSVLAASELGYARYKNSIGNSWGTAKIIPIELIDMRRK